MIGQRSVRVDLDAVFAALANPTRRALIEQLEAGDATVGELARPHSMSLAAVSQHLRVLQRAGLLSVRREWRLRRCHAEGAPMTEVVAWLEKHRTLWMDRYDQLERHLAATAAPKEDPHGSSSK